MKFDNINKTLKQNEQFLKDFIVDEIIQKGIVKTGVLARSVEVVGNENQDGISYAITMPEYGYFQDSGVKGRVGPKNGKGFTTPNPKSFFSPGTGFKSIIPWKPRTPLPFPAALAISQRGIEQRPFINYALDRFEEKLGKDIESEGIKDIQGNIEGILVKEGATVR